MKVLDHGYLEFVESWGSDERVIEAARSTYEKCCGVVPGHNTLIWEVRK